MEDTQIEVTAAEPEPALEGEGEAVDIICHGGVALPPPAGGAG